MQHTQCVREKLNFLITCSECVRGEVSIKHLVGECVSWEGGECVEV